MIYHILEEVSSLWLERIAPKQYWQKAGRAECLQIFKLSKPERIKVAGSRVVEGRAISSGRVEVILRRVRTLYSCCLTEFPAGRYWPSALLLSVYISVWNENVQLTAARGYIELALTKR